MTFDDRVMASLVLSTTAPLIFPTKHSSISLLRSLRTFSFLFSMLSYGGAQSVSVAFNAEEFQIIYLIVCRVTIFMISMEAILQ